MTPDASLRPTDLLAAFATGGLLSLMVLFNGTLAGHTTPFFSSLAAHGTGTVAAALLLALLPAARGRGEGPPAPLWAYLGGLTGAVTVMMTGVSLNSALALTGTLALGLAGQVAFSLAADRWGLFGLPRRRPTARDIAAVALITAGSLAIIFSGHRAMTLAVILALIAGTLVSVSRQINGRLALSTSALGASFWNHAVGFGLLLAAGLALGGLWPEGTATAPWFAWAGGPVGVIFVAAGSWLIARIGAVNTALLVIGGQMVSGVALDLWRAAPGDPWLRAGGVALILGGMALLQRR